MPAHDTFASAASRGYPPSKDSDILNDLLVKSQLSEAERIYDEAREEAGLSPSNPVEYLSKTNGVSKHPPTGSPATQPVKPEETSPVFPDDQVAIPPGAFLLRCASGDLSLKPKGISFEEHFIVLFFENASHLYFTPKINTRFQGEYDGPEDSSLEERLKIALYYSGITFTIPNTETVAVIFHISS